MNNINKANLSPNCLTEFKNEKLGLTYYKEILTNGLQVYLMKKPKYLKTYGIFATNYGSLDQEFIPINSQSFIKTPAGIAHFLEHKLFEIEDGNDATTLFSEIGADSNAYTTYDMTAYLFETVNNVEKAVEILLDFVQKPYFSLESIEKERGIIDEELKMYLDKPSIALHVGLLKALYKKNEVREEIGGTIESIKNITKELLDLCYQTFYHPSNMVLVVVGNFEPFELIEKIRSNQTQKSFMANPPKIKRKYHLEDSIAYQVKTTQKMDIITPKVIIGLKLPVLEVCDLEKIKNELLLMMLMEIYYDTSGDFYHELETKELINTSFDYEVTVSEIFAYLSVRTETLRVDEFIDNVKKQLLAIKTSDIETAVFNRHKKALYALSIKKLNSLSFLADLFLDEAVSNLEAFSIYQIINDLTKEDLLKVREYFLEEAIAVHIIYPLKEEN